MIINVSFKSSDDDIVGDDIYSRDVSEFVVNLLLKDISRTVQAKRQTVEFISAKQCVERGRQRDILVETDIPVSSTCVEDWEIVCAVKSGQNILRR